MPTVPQRIVSKAPVSQAQDAKYQRLLAEAKALAKANQTPRAPSKKTLRTQITPTLVKKGGKRISKRKKQKSKRRRTRTRTRARARSPHRK